MSRPTLGRRAFLAGAGAGAGAALVAGGLGAGVGCGPPPLPEPEFLPGEARSWWRDGGRYFRHDTVDTRRLSQGIVRARVDGRWRDFPTVDLPPAFVQWSFAERRARLDRLAQGIFSHRELAGPHNACVATYGGHPREGRISLNTAYKGMGWLPREPVLGRLLTELQQASALPEPRSEGEYLRQMQGKARFLDGLYRRPELFDTRCHVSLELFTFWKYYTHTFLNLMANPVASASFLAYPTFELRAIAQLLHPADPDLTPQERQSVAFINAIHDFVHGGAAPRIACIYHVIEVYEDTPTRGAQGKKLA